MNDFDAALKNLLTPPGAQVLQIVTQHRVAIWQSTDLGSVRERRPDLLGETIDGTLIHVELRSTNDSRMASRMLDYSVAIHQKFDRYPRQFVLYVGQKPLAMANNIAVPGLSFECSILDFRELDGESLLASPNSRSWPVCASWDRF